MFSGPMFRREFRAATRRRQPFARRTVMMLLLLGPPALFIYLIDRDLIPLLRAIPRERHLLLGRTLFVGTFALECLYLALFIPEAVGAAVAEERDKDTFLWLVLTRLTPLEIILTKAAARGIAGAGFFLAGLPLLIGSAALAGLEWELCLAIVVLISTSTLIAALAILGGINRTPASLAVGQATALVCGWLVVPAALTTIPVRLGTIWGDLLAEVKLVAGWVAPLSPLSLATDPGWFSRATAMPLGQRVALMVALQLGLSVAAIVLATRRLVVIERPSGWGDPRPDYRTRVGDDPIFWREFAFPSQLGGGSKIVGDLRALGVVAGTFLRSLFGLIALLLRLAIPVALVLAAIYYGSAAARERWAGAGAHVQRDWLATLIGYLTLSATCVPLLGVPGIVVGRFTVERDKKTWDAFLTTPLTGAEIVRSKAKGAAYAIWYPLRWWLPLVWTLGIATGALMPLGVACAAVDLALVTWVSIALGLFWGPQDLSKDDVSKRITPSALGLVVVHGPLLAMFSLSPHQFAAAAASQFALVPMLVVAGLVVSVTTAVVATLLIRQTIANFDRWVGRPHRRHGEG